MLIPNLPDHPFTTQEASRLGWSPKRLRTAVAAGLVRRLFTGVYVRADVEDSVRLRAHAARLVMSEHSVLCDRTAAWIHDIDVFANAELETVPPLETCVLRGHDPTDRVDCPGRTRDLLPEDWCVVAGVRVTTPLRTALDLACCLRRRDALAALDAFARHHGVTVAALNRLLARFRRRRGVVQARELAQLMDGRAESQPESWTRLEIHDAGLPPPLPQYWVVADGVQVYRLDLAYPRARVAVEYDGEEFHSSEEQRLSDARRRAWLRERGWYVIVVTKHSFAPGALAAWTSELRQVLRDRRAIGHH